MLHAELAQAGDHVEPFAAAGERRGLGQLEGQMAGRQAVAGEQRGEAQGEALVGEQARRKVDRDVEIGAALVDLRRRRDRLLEHEIGELADAVVLLGGGDEFRRGDRALFRVGPAGQRFGADDPPRRELELGLIGDPHLAASIALVELAQHRQLPRGVLSFRGRDIST